MQAILSMPLYSPLWYKSVQSQLNRKSIFQLQHARLPPCLYAATEDMLLYYFTVKGSYLIATSVCINLADSLFGVLASWELNFDSYFHVVFAFKLQLVFYNYYMNCISLNTYAIMF